MKLSVLAAVPTFASELNLSTLRCEQQQRRLARSDPQAVSLRSRWEAYF